MVHRFVPILAACCLPAVTAHASLSLTLDFSNFGTGADWSALHNDAWDGSTPNAVKQTAAQGTMQAAADYWVAAFANSTTSVSQTISVSWGPKSGSTLATGGTSYFIPSYNLTNGTLSWDNDGSSQFFVDTTPWEQSEWAKGSARTLDLGAGAINIERTFYNAPASSAARDNSDMLTVAIHEIGHALGFLGGYPPYADLDVGGDGDLDLVDGSQIAYSGGHHTLTVAYPESPAFAFPADGFAPGGSYYPTVMGPAIQGGTRKLLTAADILTVGSYLGLDNMDLNPVIVPEASTAGLLALAFCGFARRRR